MPRTEIGAPKTGQCPQVTCVRITQVFFLGYRIATIHAVNHAKIGKFGKREGAVCRCQTAFFRQFNFAIDQRRGRFFHAFKWAKAVSVAILIVDQLALSAAFMIMLCRIKTVTICHKRVAQTLGMLLEKSSDRFEMQIAHFERLSKWRVHKTETFHAESLTRRFRFGQPATFLNAERQHQTRIFRRTPNPDRGRKGNGKRCRWSLGNHDTQLLECLAAALGTLICGQSGATLDAQEHAALKTDDALAH